MTGKSSQVSSGEKMLVSDSGAAKLFERAAELRSSLDSGGSGSVLRGPKVRSSGESVSLPSSPAGSRKIGLSCLTPPTSRKMGTARNSSLIKEPSSATVSWPEVSVTSITSSQGPFTSVLKSGSLGERTVTKVVQVNSYLQKKREESHWSTYEQILN